MAVGLVDGMVTPLQFKGERVLDKIADSDHGQSESGRERRVRSALSKISAESGNNHDK